MVELRTLGSVQLEANGRATERLLTRSKPTALLIYLAAARPRGLHRRDTLLGLLWAESDAEHARGSLRHALYELKRTLGSEVVTGRGTEEVGLSEKVFSCDVRRFWDCLADGDPAGALAQYHGDFLEGVHLKEAHEFEHWVTATRRGLREAAAKAAWSLAESAATLGDAAAIAEWGQRAVAYAPYDEAGLCRLLESLDATGNRSTAVRAYDQFAERLRDELELEPAPETRALVARIRARLELTSQPDTPREVRLPPSAGVTATGVRRDETGEDSGATVETRPVGAHRRSRTLAILFAAGGLVLISLWRLVPTVGPMREAGSAELSPTRVLVMDFENETGDPSLDAVGRLAEDWVIQGLGETGLVQVVTAAWAANLARRQGATATQPRASAGVYAEASGASWTISGAYYLSGDSLGLHAQVTQTASGEVLRALGPVVVQKGNPAPAVATVRDGVMAALAGRLDRRLTAWIEPASQPPTYEAYRAFVRGLELFTREMDFEGALTQFRIAAEIDSTFTLPSLWTLHTLLSIGNSGMGVPHWNWEWADPDSLSKELERRRSGMPPLDRHFFDYLRASRREDIPGAFEAAQRMSRVAPGAEYLKFSAGVAMRMNRPGEAIDYLQRTDPERGWLRDWAPYWATLCRAYHHLGDFDAELEAAGQGRRLHPTSIAPIEGEVRALAALGRREELNRALDRAVTLSQGQDFYQFGNLARLAGEEFQAHGFAGAAEYFQRAADWLQALPAVQRTPVRRQHHILALLRLDRPEEARALADSVSDELPKGEYLGLWPVGLAAAYQGDLDHARRIMHELEVMGGDGSTMWAAAIAAILGERERALRLIGASLRKGHPYPELFHSLPAFEPLRDDPEFRELVRPKG